MGYADLTAVKRILDLEQLDAESAAIADARLAALDDALSRLFDTKVGRTWTGAGGSQTRTVLAPRLHSDLLPLPDGGILTLGSVVVGAQWTGSAWTGGNQVAAAEVLPDLKTPDGAYLALRHAYGWGWTGPVRVTASWADGGSAPDEVVEALTFVVAEEYKQEKASPEAMVGPDGLQVSTRNPWRFERVQVAIDRHKAMVL